MQKLTTAAIIREMTSNDNGENKINPADISVHTNTVVGSTFAQIYGVVVTDTDITIEFVYFSPRPRNKDAQVVSRVTMPRLTGEGLAKSISETVIKHELKKKGVKNATN